MTIPTEALTITNIILSSLIFIHLCCEFFHYIHEFLNSKKTEIKMKDLLKLVNELIEDKNNCPHKKSKKKEQRRGGRGYA